MIANTPPRIGIHNGIAGGIFKPKIIPVTRALPSLMVTGLCIRVSKMYSLSTQERTVATTTIRERIPNCITPQIVAGSIAIATSYIRFFVETPQRT